MTSRLEITKDYSVNQVGIVTDEDSPRNYSSESDQTEREATFIYHGRDRETNTLYDLLLAVVLQRW